MPSPTDQGTGVPTPDEEPIGLRRVREVEHAARRSKEADKAETSKAEVARYVGERMERLSSSLERLRAAAQGERAARSASASSVPDGGVSLWVESVPAGAVHSSGRLVSDVARCRLGGVNGPDLLARHDGRLAELDEALSSTDRDQAAIASVFLRAAVLCLRKNRDYGSSFRQSPALLPHLSAQDAVLVRIDDKDKRFANLSPDSSGAVAESRLETMRDRACYSLLWCLLEEERLSGGGGA